MNDHVFVFSLDELPYSETCDITQWCFTVLQKFETLKSKLTYLSFRGLKAKKLLCSCLTLAREYIRFYDQPALILTLSPETNQCDAFF